MVEEQLDSTGASSAFFRSFSKGINNMIPYTCITDGVLISFFFPWERGCFLLVLGLRGVEKKAVSHRSNRRRRNITKNT